MMNSDRNYSPLRAAADAYRAAAQERGLADAINKESDTSTLFTRESLILNAIRINARRDHFAEAYEGFNDCPAAHDWKAACDCGKAEAEAALRALGECPHNGYRLGLCTECGQPEEANT
jgi:hypothetical protein